MALVFKNIVMVGLSYFEFAVFHGEFLLQF